MENHDKNNMSFVQHRLSHRRVRHTANFVSHVSELPRHSARRSESGDPLKRQEKSKAQARRKPSGIPTQKGTQGAWHRHHREGHPPGIPNRRGSAQAAGVRTEA